MYYRISSLTNRLRPATQLGAYHPQGLRTLEPLPSEPIFTPYATVKTPNLAFSAKEAAPSRAYAAVPSHGSGNYSPLSPRLKALQEHFQKDDGLPVHLKGGQKDYIYYYGTVAICIVGTIWSFYEIFQMARPKKPH